MKKIFLIIIVACVASFSAMAQKSEIFATDGIAIKGYDILSFYKGSDPLKGSDSLTYKWKDVIWKFASRNNLDSFALNPDQYAPQYGGYCAYGTTRGYKAPTETNTATIVDGKLYFNYNDKVKDTWMKDKSNLIIKADSIWPSIKKQ